ncbi:MAG: hypothetical protein K1X67_10185 [Fimbriimonadaceae bacterium]|nr:hypothetical protein [Fimbriimonadaceae bacterium]
MLSEYEVRQAVAEIESCDLPPMAKARRLMSLVRTLRYQLRTLRRGNFILEQDLDFDAASRLSRLERSQERLMEDIRLSALHCLQSGKRRLSFETMPLKGVASMASSSELLIAH